MASDFRPWERYPALAEERLITVASIIRGARSGAAKLHDPKHGDDEWVLGCRTYKRTCYALQEEARRSEWLSILKEDAALAFSFAIGSIPFRFYHGKPGDPPDHYQMTNFAELRQMQLLLDLGIDYPKDQTLRLAVETGADHLVSCVTLVEKDLANHITETYIIPVAQRRLKVQQLNRPGYDPGKPKISPREQKGESDNQKYKGD